jgi:D-glycero-D-manno-heptose 1,7-bisphosphate phosphatase
VSGASGAQNVPGSGPVGPAARSGFRRRAVFVDRDGTLNPDLHYLADAQRLELFAGVGNALKLLHDHGFLAVCVTNQSGIERGLYTVADVDRIHARLNELLRPFATRVDAFYYCPHAPERGCDCRKPGTALFARAAQEWSLDLATSAIIGDRALDIEAGERLGLLTALVALPAHADDASRELAAGSLVPDIVSSSFLGAVTRVLYRG